MMLILIAIVLIIGVVLSHQLSGINRHLAKSVHLAKWQAEKAYKEGTVDV